MSDHWKSLADLLGAPSLNPSKRSSEPVAEKVQAEPVKEKPGHVEPQVAKADHPAAEPVEATKPRKRSSWEALANLFNIGSAPEPEEKLEPTTPDVSDSAQPILEPTARHAEVSLFKSTAPGQQNPALVDMFGEVTGKPHESWGKPRKMVDDLGWDEDEPVAKRAPEATVKPVRALDETAEIHDLDVTEGEPERRSRRRRRRGGRGRGEDLRANVDSRPEETSAEFRDSSWGKVVDEDTIDADEDDIPANLESEDDASTSEERRPRRRRRRRGRGRGADIAEGRAPIDDRLPIDDDVDSVNRQLLDTDDEEGPIDELFGDPTGSESLADVASDPRRRRRRKRNRGGKREESEEVRVGDLDADDADDDSEVSDADLAGEDEAGHRHRNIPTWEDSLAVLIEANIENHRRNEGRGGGPRGGGRNRGGRR